jgi:hypothetical protein
MNVIFLCKKQFRRLAFFCLLAVRFAAANGFAQNSADSVEAKLYYAEGADFVITSRGQRIVYQADNPGDFVLGKADMIQTGAEGTLEISLVPSNAGPDAGILVKIADNTTFAFNGIEEKTGTISLKVFYGRIRVKTRDGASQQVLVQAGNGNVYFQKGDFGLDFVIHPDTTLTGAVYNQPYLRFYAFSGSGSLGIVNADTPIPRVQVAENETVSLALFTPLSLVQRNPIDAESINFWEKNNFRDTQDIAVIPAPTAQTDVAASGLAGETDVAAPDSAELSTPADPIQIEYIKYDPLTSMKKPAKVVDPKARAEWLRNILLYSGQVVLGTGILAEYAAGGLTLFGDKQNAKLVSNLGFISIGVGVAAIATYFVLPRFGKK